MTARDRNVVCYSNFAVSAATNPYFLVVRKTGQGLPALHRSDVLCVYDVEAFRVFTRKGLKDYEIATGAFHLHDVDDLVVPGYFVGEGDFAQLAVHFLKLNHNVLAVHLSRAL
jgi:hypothetical protein